MEGKSAAQISAELGRSLTTIRGHVHSVLAKLEVGSQVAAVALAYRCGWPPLRRNSQF
jgi:DNA-binding CsgD family transcriptional regulator